MSAKPPVILLAFANDEDDYLKNLRRERENVEIALRPADVRQSVKIVKAEQTSIEYLFGLFRDYDGVAIFHYGGHADGAALRLESADGAAEAAHSGGLAQLFALQTGLQLVFLNGCATQGQVQTLLAAGVKAVIATAVPIDDAMATEFAEQFYGALGAGATIELAFKTARAFVTTRYDVEKTVGTFRGSLNIAKQAPTDAGLTWGLYLNDDAEAVLEWALPDSPDGKVLVRNAPPIPEDGPELSEKLIVSTMAAIAPYDPFVQLALGQKDKRGREVLVSDAYPSPIGEQLRRVFASRAISIKRLRLLVLTYEVIAKLSCFTALSQLWNARLAKPDLVISDEQWAALNSFMTLTAETQPTFDYLKLTIAIVEILAANDVEPFMVEAKGLGAELTDAPTTLARRFMDEMRVELFNDRVPDHELSSFCAQAEQHLATILADFAFIVRYKFTSIKNIGIVKNRNRNPITQMRTVWLDKVSSGLRDDTDDITSYIDVNSVVLQKQRDDLADYLNLTPFLIDENAIIGADSSKLFFYDYHDDNDVFHYASVNDNLRDRLKISNEKYPDMKSLCKEFRDAVFSR